MTPTITISDEAREFLRCQNDPALQRLLDEAVREYAEFWNGLPIEVDAFGDEDSGRVQFDVAVVAPATGSAMPQLVEFTAVWRPKHTPEERRIVGFSVHYL